MSENRNKGISIEVEAFLQLLAQILKRRVESPKST